MNGVGFFFRHNYIEFFFDKHDKFNQIQTVISEIGYELRIE